METHTGLKVLIADDSGALRQRLRRLISGIDGVETVTEAEDGTQALELMRSAVFDAAVLDIRMPGSSGLEVLQEIRKSVPSLVIIMLTNYPYLAYRVRSSEAGADFFFDKNSEFMKVLEVLGRMAKHRHTKVANGEGS
jgi:DNA-binding NarL/FixJ family response regulator